MSTCPEAEAYLRDVVAFVTGLMTRRGVLLRASTELARSSIPTLAAVKLNRLHEADNSGWAARQRGLAISTASEDGLHITTAWLDEWPFEEDNHAGTTCCARFVQLPASGAGRRDQ
ncbi:MAG: hypothetical protein LJF04_11285 [Gemmatimonadetes bacterium]|nr:hypothetical protein [Gemmatimonadota bacterium]